MTIPVSTVDAVKDYFYAQISALGIVTSAPSGGDQPVLVQYDLIGKHEPNEYVEVGDEVEGTTSIHAMVGSGQTGWLEERFRIKVSIFVYRNTTDPVSLWKRANAISQAIDTMVRNDPSLGGNAKVAHPLQYRSTSGWDREGKFRTVEIERWFEVFSVL